MGQGMMNALKVVLPGWDFSLNVCVMALHVDADEGCTHSSSMFIIRFASRTEESTCIAGN
jgi:hypothetical protein